MKEVIMQVPSFSADYPKAPIYVADLVRCKECKYKDEIVNYCYENDRDVNSDDYCSHGVKKGATEYIPLVRCKDCKWRNRFGCHNPIWGDGWANYPPPNPSDDDYCSYGEREGE